MKLETSFLMPNKYICFITALISGLLFYGALYFVAYQYLNLPVKRMLGPIESNSVSVFIYVLLYILFFWGLILIWHKSVMLRHERNALLIMEKDFDCSRIINKRSELDSLRSKVLHAPQAQKIRDTALSQMLLFLIDHCLVVETSGRIMEIFSKRLDTLQKHIESSFNILRYIAWAIPSLGFIGTVLGIGGALAQVELAMQDMSAVTQPLGMAFDTTLIALMESMVLMFFVYNTQFKEENLLNSIDLFCQENFIINLRLESDQ